MCCSYCCPTNTTELHYLEHPEDYASHPPVFLAQSALSDSNADLCAGRSYHETLLAHGVKTEIALLPGASHAACPPAIQFRTILH